MSGDMVDAGEIPPCRFGLGAAPHVARAVCERHPNMILRLLERLVAAPHRKPARNGLPLTNGVPPAKDTGPAVPIGVSRYLGRARRGQPCLALHFVAIAPDVLQFEHPFGLPRRHEATPLGLP